jgi:hypothetical protein
MALFMIEIPALTYNVITKPALTLEMIQKFQIQNTLPSLSWIRSPIVAIK